MPSTGIEIMDNFALNVRARSRESFGHAMALAFAAAAASASHWCKHPEFGLVLFWSAEENFKDSSVFPFPHKLDVAAATDFAGIG
ncbi:MAG: hypothetical protein A2831_01020 [Candidatus Yanofskybacteria bacterium RIFCSPHIGHO2_01_FULL_44_17]|uniref:Uncharacterized protein n=1 Tax=Candidatus Yanofskybacteria bacterium RIFCSPHIGHO2_01_FULL_44_17 TaxID=1802668 RepID=A0A1F8EVR6_9BACT|nr:MAG: hypothetical protein A2831_01020 [Candidatus Yanofskybacteria bacterium RIFCSPHIGHO2_01_FULL_44_17]